MIFILRIQNDFKPLLWGFSKISNLRFEVSQIFSSLVKGVSSCLPYAQGAWKSPLTCSWWFFSVHFIIGNGGELLLGLHYLLHSFSSLWKLHWLPLKNPNGRRIPILMLFWGGGRYNWNMRGQDGCSGKLAIQQRTEYSYMPLVTL